MRVYWDTFVKKYIRPKKNLFPTGSRVYKGFQGSGKTLSMVKYSQDIVKAFPNCAVFSNIKIKGFQSLVVKKIEEVDEFGEKIEYYIRSTGNYYFIKNDNDLKLALELRNGKDGALVLLDEAHLYFNKKNGISLDVLTAISQQRKDRRRLVFSSQIWEELDISLRKQVKEIVTCKCFFNKFQFNIISDGETLVWDKLQSMYTAQKIRTEVFKHYDELYKSYDTYQKIISNKEYSRIFQNNPITLTTEVKVKK